MSDITFTDFLWMVGIVAAYRLGWSVGYDQRAREEFAKDHPWFRRYL